MKVSFRCVVDVRGFLQDKDGKSLWLPSGWSGQTLHVPISSPLAIRPVKLCRLRKAEKIQTHEVLGLASVLGVARLNNLQYYQICIYII